MDLKKFEFIAEQVDRIVDSLGHPIDPGIKRAVIAFNYAGFPTSASCEGHMDWGCPFLWIEIDAPSSDANILLKETAQNLLDKFYSNREKSLCSLQILVFISNNDFRIQSPNYVPRLNVINDVIRDKVILLSLQKEMNDFADYLLNKT